MHLYETNICPDGKRWQQLPGSQYRAAEVQVGSGLHTISMNIASAYGQVPGLTYYRRTVQLTENSLQMQDITDYPGEIALTLMSEEKPEINSAAVRFGILAQMTVKGAERITTEEIPIHDDRLHLAWQNSLYRTRICFKTQIDLCSGIQAQKQPSRPSWSGGLFSVDKLYNSSRMEISS